MWHLRTQGILRVQPLPKDLPGCAMMSLYQALNSFTHFVNFLVGRKCWQQKLGVGGSIIWRKQSVRFPFVHVEQFLWLQVQE